MQNLKFWSDNGIRYITCESGYEDRVYPLRWPLYYVGARGMWDPKLTAGQIMQEACDKLYGPAAGEMLAYYRLLEQAAFDCQAAIGNWHLPGVGEVYSPGVEAEATRRLDAAAQATGDPGILARIHDEKTSSSPGSSASSRRVKSNAHASCKTPRRHGQPPQFEYVQRTVLGPVLAAGADSTAAEAVVRNGLHLDDAVAVHRFLRSEKDPDFVVEAPHAVDVAAQGGNAWQYECRSSSCP